MPSLLQQLTRTCSTKKNVVQTILFPRVFLFFFLFFFVYPCSSVINWMGHGFQYLTHANGHGQLSSDHLMVLPSERICCHGCLPVATSMYPLTSNNYVMSCKAYRYPINRWPSTPYSLATSPGLVKLANHLTIMTYMYVSIPCSHVTVYSNMIVHN